MKNFTNSAPANGKPPTGPNQKQTTMETKPTLLHRMLLRVLVMLLFLALASLGWGQIVTLATYNFENNTNPQPGAIGSPTLTNNGAVFSTYAPVCQGSNTLRFDNSTDNIILTISTVGYQNIQISWIGKCFSTPNSLVLDANSGSGYTNVYTQTFSSDNTCVTAPTQTLGNDFNNNPSINIRFTGTANNAYMDQLVIRGEQIIEPKSEFTSSGTFTFTAPAGVRRVTVEAWGGGGRGGARTSGDNVALAGGGGGAYSRSLLTVTPSSNYTVTVGAGSTTSTAAGGDSWFGTSSTILAKGGGSVADNSNTRGAGGLASAGIGDVRYNGGTGAAGAGGSYGGGGGSSAGTAAAGNFTNATTTQRAGATAPTGGGNGGLGAASGVAGAAGSTPGGGGGGGYRAGSQTTQAPGNGANGQVIVSWECPSIALTSGNSTQTVCANTAITPIVYTIGDNYVAANVTGLPAGVTHNIAGNTLTVSGSPTATGPFNYTITLTKPTGCTDDAVATGTINVNALPTASITGNNGPVCSGGDAEFFLAGTSGATVTYNINNGGNTTVVLTIGGSATVTVTGATASQTLNLVSVADANCSQTLSGSSTLTVNALPTFTYTKSNLSCFAEGDGEIFINAAGGSETGYQYQYRYRTDENESWGAWSGWINLDIDFDKLQPGQYEIQVKDSNGCIQTEEQVIP